MDVSLLNSIASIDAGTTSSEGTFKTTELRIAPNDYSIVSTAKITSHAKQQAEITNLKAENDTLKRKHENLGHNYQYLEAENRRLKTKFEPIQQLLKTAPPIVNSRPLGPPVLTMTNFQQHKRDGDEWFSPPVYTHHQGYKFSLKVYANGCSTGKGTHVSVGVYFMRGEFDDSLKWPFRGVISIHGNYWTRSMARIIAPTPYRIVTKHLTRTATE